MYVRVVLTLLLITAGVIAVELALRPRPPIHSGPVTVPATIDIDVDAGPPDESCLRQRIADLTLTNVTMETALREISVAGRVNMVWTWDMSEALKARQVGFHLKDTTVADALDLVMQPYTDFDYSVKGGTIVVSSAGKETALLTRLYPVQDILARFPAGPIRGISDGRVSPVDHLLLLLPIATAPGSWRDNGSIGNLSEWDGMLIITQSRRNHVAIEQFLARLRKASREATTRPSSATK